MKLNLQDQHYLMIKSYLCDEDEELIHIEFVGHKSSIANFEALYSRDVIFIPQLDTYLNSSFNYFKKHSLGYDYEQIILYNKEIFSHHFLIGESEEELYEKFLIWLERKQVLPIPKGDATSVNVDYQRVLYEKMIAYSLLQPLKTLNLFAYYVSDEVTNGSEEMQNLIVGVMTNLLSYELRLKCQKASDYDLAEDQIIVMLHNAKQNIYIINFEMLSNTYFALFEDTQSGEKFWDEMGEDFFLNSDYEIVYTFEDQKMYIDEENALQILNPDTMMSLNNSIIS